jgi:Siphovirus Gp157
MERKTPRGGSMKLYELTADHRSLARRLSESEDTFEADQFRAELSVIGEKFDDKVIGYCAIRNELLAEAKAVGELVERLLKRKRTLESNAEHLGMCVKENMEMVGVVRINSPALVVSIQRNPPQIDILDEGSIPKDYWRQPKPQLPTVDRVAVLAALKAGSDVPGARMIQTTRLVVK